MHFIGVLWHALGIFEINYLGYEHNWISKYGIIEENAFYIRYIYSLYFSVVTVTTVGYGDITPSNYIECLFLIGTLLISSAVYAFLINSIGNLMESIKESEKNLIED